VIGVTFSVDPQPVRILVVDPDERTRESLCGILGIGRRCVVVGSAGDAAQALGMARELRPDVMVVDAHLDGVGAGPAFVTAVRAASPATRIVVMCRTDLDEAASRCVGVDGVIRKTFRPRELVDALIAAGEPIAMPVRGPGVVPC
jgi:two-component system nitrate/nitrite response regulator NarL